MARIIAGITPIKSINLQLSKNCADSAFVRYENKMPMVIASWNKETSAPLIFSGEISDKYKGAQKLIIPIAKPTINLETIKTWIFGAMAQRIEPMKNINAVTKITFFLPKISANLPFKIAPNAAPIKTVETKSPCINSLNCHSPFIYKSAPEITPVSKPDNKPPRATKNATRYNIFFISISLKIPIRHHIFILRLDLKKLNSKKVLYYDASFQTKCGSKAIQPS